MQDSDSQPALKPSMIDDIDKFLANVSDTMPTPDQILHVGQPWGALHEKLTGSKLAKGLYFNVSKTGEAAPWLELIQDGKFSAQTLKLTRESLSSLRVWRSAG